MRKIYVTFLILAGLTIVVSAGNAVAQIKIGTNGANIAPASLLELESANQGLLIPRMANTVAIDALNPPNGMLIYITTEPSGLYVKKATGWEYLTGFLGGNAFFNSLTVTGAVTAGSFSGPLTGNATTATTALNSTNSANSAVTNDISSPGITYPVFVNSTPGNQPLRTSSGNLSYIPATGILTARGFNGPLVGDVTGNATSSIDAQNTVNLRITDDIVSPTTMYPTLVGGTSGPLPARVSSSRLSFIPLTGELTAPIFRGNLLGNASSATSVTGNVAAVNGGTGQSIYTPGDILYASTSNTLAKLPIGVPGTVLRVSPTSLPAWSTAGAGTVINVSGAPNRISVSDPMVSPVIDIDVNYAGQASINTVGTITAGTWNGSPVPVSSGGTGLPSLPTGLLVGNGTLPVTTVTGLAGYVLTSTGLTTPPLYSPVAGGDMILATPQTVTGNKTFADGTLRLNGSTGGITTLIANASSSATVELPPNGIIVNRDRTETLINKTLTSPILNGTPNLGSAIGTSLAIGGNITAGSFTGPLTGNVTGDATRAFTLINPLAGDVTGPQGATVVSFVDGIAASVIRLGAQRANAATATNNANTIVSRDLSGNFVANQITAMGTPGFIGSLNGNATTVTTIPALSGEVSNIGNVVTLSNAAVILKTLTGYTTATTPVTAGDNIVQAIGKVEGNANSRAPINSPIFAGTVSIPSPFNLGVTSVTTTGTQLNYLSSANGVSGTDYVVLNNSPTFTGTPTLPTGTIGFTQGPGNSSTALATTAFVTTANNLKANIASPTFTGVVTIPSPFNLGPTATPVTTTGAQLNFLNGAVGTTGATTSSLVFSASPTLTTPVLGLATVSSITGNSPPPTATAGGGITLFTISGTNLSGSIELTSDGTGAGNATLLALTYAGLTYPTNSYPILTPANPATAALLPTTQIYIIGNPGNFLITSGTNTLPPGVYKWNYMVSGN